MGCCSPSPECSLRKGGRLGKARQFERIVQRDPFSEDRLEFRVPLMPTVAYLAIQFPSLVEPYVTEEIEELRRRGVQVIPGSVRKITSRDHDHHKLGLETVV